MDKSLEDNSDESVKRSFDEGWMIDGIHIDKKCHKGHSYYCGHEIDGEIHSVWDIHRFFIKRGQWPPSHFSEKNVISNALLRYTDVIIKYMDKLRKGGGGKMNFVQIMPMLGNENMLSQTILREFVERQPGVSNSSVTVEFEVTDDVKNSDPDINSIVHDYSIKHEVSIGKCRLLTEKEKEKFKREIDKQCEIVRFKLTGCMSYVLRVTGMLDVPGQRVKAAR